MENKASYPTPRGEAANKAKAKYNAKAYDQFLVTVPKGFKDKISEAAARAGKSRNAFIVDAIIQAMEK